MADKKYPAYGELNPAQKKLALAKWHKNKGTDSPTQLSPAAKQALLHKRYLAQEVAPGLTRGDMLAQTRAATHQKFGEDSAALTGSVQQNQAQTKRTADWYRQYQQAIAEAGAKQAQINGQAVAGVQNLQAGLDASSQQQWAGEQQAMSADAASRGATVDPTLAAKAHNASDIRGVLTNSYGAMLLNQGKAQESATARQGATSVQQKIEALGVKQLERADLAKQRVQMNKDKGDFKVTYRAGLKTAAAATANTASQSSLARALAAYNMAQIGAKTKNTQADTAKTAAETKFLKVYGYLPGTKPSALDAAKLAYIQKHGYAMPTGPPKQPGAGNGKDGYGNTPLQRTSRTSDFRKILAAANLQRKAWDKAHPNAAIQHPTGYLSAIENSDQMRFLQHQYPAANLDILRGAIQQAVYGHVGPQVKKALKQLGVDQTYWDR